MKRKKVLLFTLLGVLISFSGCGSYHADQSAEVETSSVEASAEMTKAPETSYEATTPETTEAPEETTSESAKEWTHIEQSADEIRHELLTVTLGTGEGQVSYDYMSAVPDGPQSFAVEGEKIYILDKVNGRINIYENGECSQIEIAKNVYSRMRCQNGYIVLVDNTHSAVLKIYREDGTLVAEKEYPSGGEIWTINGVLEVGDGYVEFVASEVIYRYRWAEDKTEVVRNDDRTEGINDEIQAQEEWIFAIGKTDDAIFYGYVDMDAQSVTINWEVDYTRHYVELATSTWYLAPLEQYYLAEDGRMYVMECFEDRVVISEWNVETE